MQFNITATEPGGRARSGKLTTAHSEIDTPVFMPVGTQGTVKAVHQSELQDEIDARILLGNTYHLNLRPGTKVIEAAGGLHKFMGWDRSILTDSGGYQVFSLAENRKISEEGVSFRSHIDGSSHFLSPETSIEIQKQLGADIIMAFDECTSFPCEYSDTRKSMELTHRWLKRSVDHFKSTGPLYGYDQSIFPIVQGGMHADLRKQSAETVASYELEGNAIGGLSVGEPAEEMYRVTDIVCGILPADKPRYLMGVGTPSNLLECIDLGVDMFDCVMPARNGRNGMLFTSEGIINIRNEKWKNDFNPIDENAHTFVDTAYSKAYLRHLMISGERLGAQIATIHNLGFYAWLMKESRNRISHGTFRDWKSQVSSKLMNRI